MFLIALYFIPALISFQWVLSYMIKSKSERQWLFFAMLIVDVFYFASNAVYLVPHTDYDVMVWMDAVCVPAFFALFAMEFLYVFLLLPGHRFHISHLLLLFPSVVFGTMVNLLYYIIGFDNAARLIEAYDITGKLAGEFDTDLYRLYVFIDDTLINYIAILLSVLFFVFLAYALRKEGYKPGDVVRFLSGKSVMSVNAVKVFLLICNQVVLLPYAILGRQFMCDHILITSSIMVMVGVILNLLSYLEYRPHDGLMTIREMRNSLVADAEAVPPAKTVVEREDTNVSETITESHNIRLQHLASEFTRLMEEGAYRDENISLAGVAEKLGVSPRTMSGAINEYFGRTFREILNDYRIEAAKKYLREHPDATQSSVAYECGFKDDSSFNKKFKEAVGITPLVWMTRNANS